MAGVFSREQERRGTISEDSIIPMMQPLEGYLNYQT